MGEDRWSRGYIRLDSSCTRGTRPRARCISRDAHSPNACELRTFVARYRRAVRFRPSFSRVLCRTNVLFFLPFSVGRRALAPMYEPVPPVRRAPRCCHLFASLLLTFCTPCRSSSWAFPSGAQPSSVRLQITTEHGTAREPRYRPVSFLRL